MLSNFEVVTVHHDHHWFLAGADYQANYRLIISYIAVKKTYKEANNFSEGYAAYEFVLNCLKEAHQAIDNGGHYRLDDFIEILPLKDEYGYVFVDHTETIYPLILYSERIERNGEPRNIAFRISLESVIDHLYEVLDILRPMENLNDWNQEYQNRILDILN